MVKSKLLVLLVGILVTLPLLASEAIGSEWWDKFGKPQYGGTIAKRVASLNAVFDGWAHDPMGERMWTDHMYSPDWTLDRKEFAFNTAYTPYKYLKGCLVEKWEVPDLSTLILHINQNAHWQNKEPINGRPFTAYDLEYYYNRLLGRGSGYTKPFPRWAHLASEVKSVIVEDDHTITIEFTEPGMGILFDFVQIDPSTHVIEPPEVLEASGGFCKDWHNAVGTGAWILTDFKPGSYAHYIKNPDYWVYDERYPENRLPYADELRLLCIPDISTALAALRTGKLDMLEEVSLQQAQTIAKTNPELEQAKLPTSGYCLAIRAQQEPFNDIRVRKALQMSVNRKALASGYYMNTVDPQPCGVAAPQIKECCYSYGEWPQALKDEYSYNPEKARQLLAEAGYPDGFKTNILTTSRFDTQVAEVLKSYFLDIGVDAEIESVDFVAALKLQHSGDYGLIYSNQTAMSFALIMIVQSYFSTDMNLNRSGVKSPEYDVLKQKYISATTYNEALSYIKEMDKMGLEQHWMVHTFPTYTYNIYQPRLKGYSGEYIFGSVIQGFYWNRVWVDQKLKKTLK
jgi:peptide/nickel transport system substrate-binding protein